MARSPWASFFAAYCIATAAAMAAEPVLYEPYEAIEKFGGFAVSDGSSYFSFSKDGTFISGPMRGESGRTMTGRWAKAKDHRFLIATVKLGWDNGFQPAQPEYRRVAFLVSYLRKSPKPTTPMHERSIEIFDSYFLIDEMTIIPQPPEEPKPSPSNPPPAR